MKHKNLLFERGHTSEGLIVWGGVYAFFETHGLPLGDILFELWAKGGIPDWGLLVKDMVAAGRPFARSIETISSAIGDACYPNQFRDEILSRLQKLTE